MPELAAAVSCVWREDIDSLAFRIEGHEGYCVIHRRAFRALLGAEPTPDRCRDYFGIQERIFHTAAAKKIKRTNISTPTNLHLNSRDIRRELKSHSL